MELYCRRTVVELVARQNVSSVHLARCLSDQMGPETGSPTPHVAIAKRGRNSRGARLGPIRYWRQALCFKRLQGEVPANYHTEVTERYTSPLHAAPLPSRAMLFGPVELLDEDADERLLAGLGRDLAGPAYAPTTTTLTGEEWHHRWSREQSLEHTQFQARTETPEQRRARRAESRRYRMLELALRTQRERARARGERWRELSAEALRRLNWREGPQYIAWTKKLDDAATTLQNAGFEQVASQLRWERQHLGETAHLSVPLPGGLSDELVELLRHAIRPPSPQEVLPGYVGGAP